jgi:hypothetical protein
VTRNGSSEQMAGKPRGADGLAVCPAKKAFRFSRTMLVVLRNEHPRKGNAVNDFITKYQNELTGTLTGFDRLVLRGTLWRDRVSGMKSYLWAHGLGCKDFGEHAEQISKRA